MPQFATSNRASLRFIKEPTFDVATLTPHTVTKSLGLGYASGVVTVTGLTATEAGNFPVYARVRLAGFPQSIGNNGAFNADIVSVSGTVVTIRPVDALVTAAVSSAAGRSISFAWQDLRYTGETFNYAATFEPSQEIRADRMTPDTVLVGRTSEGDVNGEISYGTYDSLIEHVMYNDWQVGASAYTANDLVIASSSDRTTVTAPSGTPFSGKAIVGQFVRITIGTGDNAPRYYAEVESITNTVITTIPLSSIPNTSAGTSITVTPMDYIRNGTTLKSFRVQKAFNDLATPEYWTFSGLRSSTWGLEISTDSILTTSFGFMGTDAEMNTTSAPAANTITDASTTPIMNAVSNIASINLGHGNESNYFNSLSINMDNQLRGQSAVSHLGYVGLSTGRLSITGSVEMYFENRTQYNAFESGSTTFPISFVAEDSENNAYVVTLPNVKYTSFQAQSESLDQDIMASMEFEAIMNTAGTYQYQISRVAA